MHSSFFSIGGGFNIPDEFEYMMREELEPRLVFLDRTGGEGVESLPLRPICAEEGIDCVLFLFKLLNR